VCTCIFARTLENLKFLACRDNDDDDDVARRPRRGGGGVVKETTGPTTMEMIVDADLSYY